MKRSTYALLAGAMAFGLTAAAAAGVAFTISTVENVPGTDFDTEVVATTPCEGTYAVDWTINQFGFVTSFVATRTAPTPDTNGAFCKNVPAHLSVSRSGTVLNSVTGTTDSTTGDFTGTFDAGFGGGLFVAAASDVVRLEIGPLAGQMPPG